MQISDNANNFRQGRSTTFIGFELDPDHCSCVSPSQRPEGAPIEVRVVRSIQTTGGNHIIVVDTSLQVVQLVVDPCAAIATSVAKLSSDEGKITAKLVSQPFYKLAKIVIVVAIVAVAFSLMPQDS